MLFRNKFDFTFYVGPTSFVSMFIGISKTAAFNYTSFK